jgi:hypothetical protein
MVIDIDPAHNNVRQTECPENESCPIWMRLSTIESPECVHYRTVKIFAESRLELLT